jgi:hypothetical protein
MRFVKGLFCNSIHNPYIYIVLITAFVTLKHDMDVMQYLISVAVTI